jgi:hypothetical protein
VDATATWPDATGTFQENSPAFHPAGDLHAPVLSISAESPFHVEGGTKEILTSCLQRNLHHALVQSILFHSNHRELRLVLH